MKKLFRWITVVVTICGLIWFGIDYWTTANLRKVCQDWPLLDRSLSELPLVYPATSAGQSAKDLQALYEKISLSDSQKIGIRQSLKNYLYKEIENPVETIGRLPSEIQKILHDNRKILEQIANLMIKEDILILPLDLEINPAEPVPQPSLWIHSINTLLLVSALSAQLEGAGHKAWMFLEASAHLNDSLFHQPSLISQGAAIVGSRNILFVMRKMTVPAPDWAQDWPSHDFVKRMLLAYTETAHTLLNMANKTTFSALYKYDNELDKKFGNEPVKLGAVTQFVYALAGQPLFRFFVSEQIAEVRRMIEKRSREGLCAPLSATIEERDKHVLSRYPGKEVLSSLAGTEFLNKFWNHLYLLAVYKTGTQTILETKNSKAKSVENCWPREPVNPAGACFEHLWSYLHNPDGSVIFFYDRSFPEDTSVSRMKPGYLKYIGGRVEKTAE